MSKVSKVQEQFKIGTKFGDLEVIGEVVYRQDKTKRRPYCRVRCNCGYEWESLCFNVKDAKRCRECSHASYTVHGARGTLLYGVWCSMKRRCDTPSVKAFKNYGGRGIRVCHEWQDDFLAFKKWAEENGYREDLEIDRKDVNGHYEPSNCRWVTATMNQRNKRSNRMLTAFGETKTMADWAEDHRCRVKYSGLIGRIRRGWDVEKAISTPRVK